MFNTLDKVCFDNTGHYVASTILTVPACSIVVVIVVIVEVIVVLPHWNTLLGAHETYYTVIVYRQTLSGWLSG